MPRLACLAALCLAISCALAPAASASSPGKIGAAAHKSPLEPPQETGFLNRRIELHGTTYRFQVYLPEEWHRDDHKLWPIILFLHGRGERGSEGMWQTQIGLPEAVRDHPERWPFVIVMPQCLQGHYWTDPDMLDMAMATLDQETSEFRGDPERTYLTGISLGGYGAWELARLNARRWAAIAIAAGGIFWSYDPERWQQVATLPANYARDLGHTPIWLFHGTDDTVVAPRQSELMYEAVKAAGGRVRLWLYEGLPHDCWTQAFNEPELPRWLLGHRNELAQPAHELPAPPPFAERIVIPLHPPAIKLSTMQMDALAGEYCDPQGHPVVTILRKGDELFEKDLHGAVSRLAAESPTMFFHPDAPGLNGINRGSAVTAISTARLIFEHDAQGRITALLVRDDRYESRWERRNPTTRP